MTFPNLTIASRRKVASQKLGRCFGGDREEFVDIALEICAAYLTIFRDRIVKFIMIGVISMCVVIPISHERLQRC